MATEQYLKLSPQVIRMIRWVKLAASTDNDRPVLKGVHFFNGELQATDGFRVHVWDFGYPVVNAELTPETKDSLALLKGIPNGIYFIHIYGPIFEYEPPATPMNYPDIRVIKFEKLAYLREDAERNALEVSRVALQPFFFAEALSAPVFPRTHVTIEQGASMRLIWGPNALRSGGVARAIIQPMCTIDDPIPRLGPIDDNRNFDALLREQRQREARNGTG